ncbi:MAG: hypothetical protein ACJAUP_000852 [Cellvibrionaceae bacterium]|jgi:hypothetical protein
MAFLHMAHSQDPYNGYICRRYLYETPYAQLLRRVVIVSEMTKRVTAHFSNSSKLSV